MAASLLRISRQMPAAGTPRSRSWRGTGVKLQTARTAPPGVDPFEAGRVGVELVEGGLLPVDPVEVGDEAEEPGMGGVVEEVPVEGALVAPLAPLAQLVAHEQEFLAGLGELVAVEEPEVGVLRM